MERKWWALVVVSVAIFMLLIDITVVNVALPDIQRALDAGFTQLQWVIDAYSLALAVFVLNAGALADLLGRKRVFLAGLTVFVLGSLTCGLATGSLFLIVSRGVQGLGGAVMFATSLALITEAFTGRDRATAFGVWGATTGAAVAVGPLIGGVLTTALDWRWIFFVNVPIGLVAGGLAWFRLDESKDPQAKRVDWLGLVTLSGSLSLLVYALLRGNGQGWTGPLILGFLGGAAVLIGLFVVVERMQERAMLDLSLFRTLGFTGAQLTAFLLSASAFSVFLYLTLYLQNVLGYSALGAGLRLLPLSVMSFALAPLAGRLSSSVPMRALLAAGLGLIAGGFILLTGLSVSSGWIALVAGFVVIGAGIGTTNPPLASTAIAVAPIERSGMASGVNNMFRQVGIATGIAGLGAVFQDHIQASLRSALAGTPAADHVGALAAAAASGRIGPALRGVPAPARGAIRTAADRAFVTGLNELFWISAVVAFAGAVVALAMVRRRDLKHGQQVADEEEPAAA